MSIEKRRRCLSDREVANIAVRVFNGERIGAIANDLGVSGSYLSRLVKGAHTRGLVRVEVAADLLGVGSLVSEGGRK